MDAMEPKKEFLRRREEILGEKGEELFTVCEIGETVIINDNVQTIQSSSSPAE